MRNIFTLFLILIFGGTGVYAQEVLWASKVLGFSSQYEDKKFSAEQILGKPDVLPEYKDSPCAWSPFKDQNKEEDWIKVGYQKPMRIRQVAIAESHNPGAVTRVYLYDNAGKEYQVYQEENIQTLPDRGRMLRITFPLTRYEVVAVKIVLNTFDVLGFNHIDAIGISSSEVPVNATINIAENLEFDGKPQNLGTGVNSRYDEIMPIISPDGKTLYFDRKDHPENTENKKNDDIWVSVISESGLWSRAENIGDPLNNAGHNFLSAITPDGNTALLGNVYEPDGSMSSGLSISHTTKDGWAFPKKITIENYYNKNRYSEFHMGADGRTIIMAIERLDTEGGKDLYVSFKKADGRWSEPINLGPTANSANTEMSPFLAADGKTIYYSSNGFSGYGSHDMYMIRRLDDTWQTWTEPQNLGPMINSSNWDAYYSIPASGDYAYFSSENHSIGKTDIFRIKLPKELKPDPVVLVFGKVLDKETKEPIVAEIVYETLKDGKEIGTAYSSPTTGEYKIVLPAGEKYGFRAKGKNYLSVNENLDLTSITEYDEVQFDLFLVPMRKGETVVLNNIFFSPSSSQLTSDSYPELNRVVDLLNENPSVTIQVSGHTNNSCTEEYCKKLSTARAQSVYNYLIYKGIPKDRLDFKGYGSRRPIASNETAEGKRINRRVEFTIIGI
ncbi:MAG: OmpA family protein [Bacteroidia bacterium]|nr:OmpA family protein [Bacteroidia bacterium]